MQTFLICEDEVFGDAVRQVMIQEGVDCPLSALIPYGQVARWLAAKPADLIVAVLPDDPLQSAEALELLASAPRGKRTLVIAIGPSADTKLVIRALRGVVDDYVDISEMKTELVTALASWRRKWSVDRPEGQLIAVLGPSGGAGSSTIAASLAVQMARELESVALIDLKLETGDLSSLLDLSPTYSLADLSKNIDRLDEVFFRKVLVPHASGVQLLAAPKPLSDVELVTAEGIRQSIGLARASFPAVIVDIDHRFDEDVMQVLRQADVILIVFRLDFTSLKHAGRFMEHLDGLGIPMDRIRLVVNRHGSPRELPFAKAEEALKAKIFQTLPDDPKSVTRAHNHGVPVVLDAPSSNFSKSLAKLALALKPFTNPVAAQTVAKPPKEPVAALLANQRRDQVEPGIPPAFDPKPHLGSLQGQRRFVGGWRT